MGHIRHEYGFRFAGGLGALRRKGEASCLLALFVRKNHEKRKHTCQYDGDKYGSDKGDPEPVEIIGRVHDRNIAPFIRKRHNIN